MHFGAYAYVGKSVTDPASYYANNLGGSISLLEAMREVGVDKIVFSSRPARPTALPPCRSARPCPITGGRPATKLAIERALRWYGDACVSGGSRCVISMPPAPDPEGEDWQMARARTPPASRFRSRGGDQPIDQRKSTSMEPIPTATGQQYRDYIHVPGPRRSASARARTSRRRGAKRGAKSRHGRGHWVREVIRARGGRRQAHPVS